MTLEAVGWLFGVNCTLSAPQVADGPVNHIAAAFEPTMAVS